MSTSCFPGFFDFLYLLFSPIVEDIGFSLPYCSNVARFKKQILSCNQDTDMTPKLCSFRSTMKKQMLPGICPIEYVGRGIQLSIAK